MPAMTSDTQLAVLRALPATVFPWPQGAHPPPRPVRGFNHPSYRGWYTNDSFDTPLDVGSTVILDTIYHGSFHGHIHGIGYVHPSHNTCDLELKGYWSTDDNRVEQCLHLFVATNNLSRSVRFRWHLRNLLWRMGGLILPSPETWLRTWSPLPNGQDVPAEEVYETLIGTSDADKYVCSQLTHYFITYPLTSATSQAVEEWEDTRLLWTPDSTESNATTLSRLSERMPRPRSASPRLERAETHSYRHVPTADGRTTPYSDSDLPPMTFSIPSPSVQSFHSTIRELDDELGSGTWLIPASDKTTEDEDGSAISFLHSVPEEEEM